jgi:hypothetical protein
MAQPGRLQAAFTSGEVAQEVYARSDLKQFYSAAKLMQNVESIPQGGFRLLPRTRDIGGIRGNLEEISGTLSTDLGPHEAPAAIAEIMFFETTNLSVVDIRGMSADQDLRDCLQVEYLDAATSEWIPILSPFAVSESDRSRRAALPPQQPVSATGVRLRFVLEDQEPITLAIDEFKAYQETGEYHAVSARPFSFAQDQTYVMTFGHQHVDVWREGVFVGCAATQIPAVRVREMVEVQQLDLMLLYLDQMPTGRLFRSGADHEWDSRPQEFDNVPNVDYGDDYERTSDLWQVILRHPGEGAAGLALTWSVNDEDTVSLVIPDPFVWADYENEIKAAIEALPSVSPGITVTSANAGSNARAFSINFTGEGNLGLPFVVNARVVNSVNAGASSLQLAKADAGGEPLFSEARGYPSCGRFYQERLFSGGFQSRRGAILASPSGDFFSGNIEIEAASGGILLQLSTRGAERIVRFAESKHLVIFTSDAEYYVSDRRISREQPVNVVESTRQGIAPDVPVVEAEEGLFFVSRNRSVIFSHVYDDIDQGYRSEPISLLASHLIRGVRGAAMQRAEENNDAGRYILVRDDGMVIVGVIIRAQEVVGFNRWVTAGKVLDVVVDGANRVWMIVERAVNGQAVLRLERWDEDVLVDAAIERIVDSDVVTGLELHEGAEVYAQCECDGDEWIFGPFTVADAQITLPRSVHKAIVGRWTAPSARTLPPPRDIAENVVLKRKARVHGVIASLIGTTSIAIAANGGRPQDLPFLRAGMQLDRPAPAYTGDVSIDGLLGYSDDGEVEITQLRPGRLQVSALVVQVKI